MDIINIAPEIICISNPFSGKLPRVSVVPNNPINAGNKPMKHPGQAPPRSVPNIAIIEMELPVFETFFRSFNFPITRIMVKDTRKGMIIKFISAKLIAKKNLKLANNFGTVM